MARIRTIKPEFWTDEKIVQLPFEARLLFVGMWNFCDDEGFLSDEPERIKLQVLPNDDIDIEALIDLLCATDLVVRYELADGRRALHVRTFSDHQKVSHATASKFSREGSRKLSIPPTVRRKVAEKYGCPPGGSVEVSCYYCGLPGHIWWPQLHKSKRPGYWVALTLELDHFVPEASGGETSPENIVLACRHCNRSKGSDDGLEFMNRRPKAPDTSGNSPERSVSAPDDSMSVPENSRALRPEGNGIDQGREGKGEGSARGEGNGANRRRRGTRLPYTTIDEIPDEWTQWAIERYGNGRETALWIDREQEKFCNFWTAKSGLGSAKLDWFATFKNWFLKAEELSQR